MPSYDYVVPLANERKSKPEVNHGKLVAKCESRWE
jgi:hypothetical protein